MELIASLSGFTLLEDLWLDNCLRGPQLEETFLRDVVEVAGLIFRSLQTLRSVKLTGTELVEDEDGDYNFTIKMACKIRRQTLEWMAERGVSLENMPVEIFEYQYRYV